MPAPEVRFAELTRAQCDAVLARNEVGRVAYCDGAHVGVRPLHYVLDDGWIYGRTTAGEKIDAVRRNWWVGFEVDEMEGPFDWRSVLVHGGFYSLSPEDTADREHYDRAVNAIRRVSPEAFTEADPVPERTVVFGIAVQEINGRMAWTGESPPLIQVGSPPRPQSGV